ncbi:MAG: tetratricopeptide repeat protein [Anaerolineae bacterium]|jgi:tetratricopeptide (TPR) repeat protein
MGWLLPVALAGFCVSAIVGPWVAYCVLDWLLRRPEHQWSALEWRMRMLRQAHRQQAAFWPEQPRPGRYEVYDRQAQEHLQALNEAVERAQDTRPLLAFYATTSLTPGDLLAGRVWGPLREVWRAWRAAREALEWLEQGSAALEALVERRHRVNEIPRVVRVNLGMVRGRLGEIRAALDSLPGEPEERAALAARLEEYDRQAQHHLRAVKSVSGERLPEIVQDVDAGLDALRVGLAEIEAEIEAAAPTEGAPAPVEANADVDAADEPPRPEPVEEGPSPVDGEPEAADGDEPTTQELPDDASAEKEPVATVFWAWLVDRWRSVAQWPPVARWRDWRRSVDERRYGPEQLPIHWNAGETNMTISDRGGSGGAPGGGDEAVRGDARYRKGLTHLQAGQWDEAITVFTELAVDYPDSAIARRALDEARFKADLDEATVVRPKRWIFPWRRVAVYAAIFACVALLAVGGAMAIGRPAMQEIREQSRQAGIARRVRDCNATLETESLDAAERCYADVLVDDPANLAAVNGLNMVSERRELLDAYATAVTAQEQGRYDEALAIFTDIIMHSPRYKDVSQRISAIARQKDVDALYAEAEADYESGNYPAALAKYEVLREQNINYRTEEISARVFDINLTLGKEIIYSTPPQPGRMAEARDYLDRALVFRPRHPEAVTEARLVRLFIDGRAYYDQARWDDAIGRLRPLYDERPGYMGGLVVEMLYDAYIASGDALRETDSGRAYEQYRRASTLNMEDTALALQRMESVVPFLTPTATPTNTPLPTNTPRPIAAGGGPTATPTPPTVRTLSTYRNQIIFMSDHPQQPGLWVMDANGMNRQYLGDSAGLRREFEELVKSTRLSPDGRYRLFVRNAGPSAQIFVQLPVHEQYGELPPRQLTRHTGLSYDPAWSPDGSRVVYVSQEDDSDDIWVINTDGTRARNLTRNEAWDKHPSWSPDGNRIVFWSSRTGRRQIFVMDAEGRDAQNISNTNWDEYDPVWVR